MPTFNLTLANMKVGTRMLLASAIPLLLVAAFAIWLWSVLSALESGLTEQLASNQSMALLAREMQRDVVQVQQYLSDVSATRAMDGLDDGFELAAQSKDSFNKHLAEYAELSARIHDDSQAATIAKLHAKFNAYYDLGVSMAQAYVAGGPEAGNRLMGSFDDAATVLHDELTTFVDAALASLNQQMASMVAHTALVRELSGGLVVAIGCLMLTLSYLLAKGITKRLGMGVSTVQAIASGNLTQAVAASGRDEIAELMLAMEHMRKSLVELVSRAKLTSEDVAKAGVEIAQGNSDLSSRTEQQATAIEETAASMEQLRSTAMQTAENARNACALAEQASTAAAQGGDVVGQVVDTMREINASSRKIADIVGLIDSIAFQTNILALNAAVEAAIAGEQGRGFAVVASEVRGLAGRSATAAKQIKQLIDDSVSKVDIGTDLVDRAGEAMSRVVDAINRSATLIAEIDAAASEQSRGVTEASEAVSMMDQVTQQNAALVEQINSSATHLSGNAKELVDVISAFRTDANQ